MTDFRPRTVLGVCSVPLQVALPIPLTERQPEPADCDGLGQALYGCWDSEDGRWNWGLQNHPDLQDTHWVSAHAEAVPETAFRP